MSNEPAPGSKSGCAAGLVIMVWYGMVLMIIDAHFAFQASGRLEERLAEDPGFPGEMPYYFRHTNRFLQPPACALGCTLPRNTCWPSTQACFQIFQPS
jgi:hypothetical protein